MPAMKLISLFSAIIGTFMLIFPGASSSTSFRLKSAEFYFQDPKYRELLRAALDGDLPQAKRLVIQGACPNAEGPLDNQYNRLRLLHYVIAANNPKAVEILLSVGADPELSAIGFGAAFLFAMTLENHAMLSLLLDLRPLNTLSNDTIDEMLFESVSQGCRECLSILLQRKAPVDFRDGSGYTILMRAMDAQDYDMAEWILSQGASVDVVPASGVTPANSVEFNLNKFQPGSPTYNKVLRLKQMMAERGAVFPAPTPAEVRAKRGRP